MTADMVDAYCYHPFLLELMSKNLVDAVDANVLAAIAQTYRDGESVSRATDEEIAKHTNGISSSEEVREIINRLLELKVLEEVARKPRFLWSPYLLAIRKEV